MNALFAFALGMALWVSNAAAAETSPTLDHVTPDLSDTASLQRGVALFTNYCMGCHSMEYARYKRVADDLDIPVSLYQENLIFTGARVGDLMENAMDRKQAAAWFGAPPPDLTLEARLRGASWIYSYLRGFYQDDSRPFGVNNAVFPNVSMPHALVGLQGLCAEKPRLGQAGEPLCTRYAAEGTLSPADYDQAIYDLTNFLAYSADPIRPERERLGLFVLLFMGVFIVFAYLLNREYWKDVH